MGAQLQCGSTKMPSHLPATTCLPVCCVTTLFHGSTDTPVCLPGPSASNGTQINACSHASCVPALPHSTVHMPISLHAMVQCCHVVMLVSATSQCHHVAAWASMFRNVMFQRQHRWHNSPAYMPAISQGCQAHQVALWACLFVCLSCPRALTR